MKNASPVRLLLFALLLLVAQGAWAADAVTPVTAPQTPSLTETLLRLIGGLLLVFGIFLGCVWLLKRAPGMLNKRNDSRKLQVLEVRSLAPRQALYVIGYEQQRYLLASTPTGVNLITVLPTANPNEPVPAEPAAGNFTDALFQAIQKQGQS